MWLVIKLKNVVVEWKDETQMHLNVNHKFLNNNAHKGISMFSKLWCYTYW
jgi:hypothetical protein